MLDLILTSTLSSAIQTMLGKALEGPAQATVRRVSAKLGKQPVRQATAAFQAAVEAARQEMVADYWQDEDELSREVVVLFERPAVAEEVTRRLLFRGEPDFERLRRAYVSAAPEPDEAGERWQALEGQLEVFFDVIEQHLAVDPHLGPLLRDTRRLAALTRLGDAQQLVAEASFAIRTASERSSELLEELLAGDGRREAHLGEIRELLERWLERSGAPQGLPATAAHLAPAEATYLRLLRRDCNRLPLAEDPRNVGVPPGQGASLARVYIDLETTTEPPAELVLERLGVPLPQRAALLEKLAPKSAGGRPRHQPEEAEAHGELALGGEKLAKGHPLEPWVEDEKQLRAARRPLTAWEAFLRHRHLVLLGDPGSGKSTFVNHLAIRLADGLLGDSADPEPAPSAEPLFPVRLELRSWSAQLEPTAAGGDMDGLQLLYRMLDQLAADVGRERWLERLADPNTLMLFDGLDEVPAADADAGASPGLDRRRLVLDAVEAFREAHPACRVLVTCRIKPYQDPRYQLGAIPTFQLAPLDDERIQRFCRRWYAELARGGQLSAAEEGERRQRLAEALGQRPVLRQMAGTPLLLTMLARVNARAVLPESRAELYDECIEQLLWEWERQKSDGGGVESLASLLARPSPAEPGVTLKRSDFERVLWELTYDAHGQCGKEGTVDLPAGLLRESLAAVHPQRDQGWAWANRVVELLRQRGGLLIETAQDVFSFPHRSFQEYLACRWLLEAKDAAGTARRLAGDDAWPEVLLLSCGYLSSKGRVRQLQTILHELIAGQEPQAPEEWLRVLIAGQAWRDFGPHRAVGRAGEELGAKIPQLLTRLMQHPDLAPAERLEAGLIASDLGALPDDLDSWVEVAGGELGYALRIGRYPVTNAQFRRFVEAGGYERENGWFSEEVQREIVEFWSSWPEAPRLWSSSSYNRASQPVTAITWHEANAYAAWLTSELRQSGDISSGQAVRLPTPAEWQLAAAGPEDREYPWEGPADERLANTEENGLGRPTPVHMYPAGATPEGILDLCGNVWEWTNEESQRNVVLAGGAWYQSINDANTAARVRINRDSRGDDVGFRLVVVPISRL